MKQFLLLLIRLYWLIIPKKYRRKCIFRKSCSMYVYEVIKAEGALKGLKAFTFRFKNCRSGYHLFNNHNDGCKIMILPNAQVIQEKEIAERLIKFN